MLASWKAKIAAFFGVLASLALVYLIGRRNRKGEVNVEVAQRELELANTKHDKLAAQLDALHEHQTNIIADILEEETARLTASNTGLTDEQILDRLRTDHLIK